MLLRPAGQPVRLRQHEHPDIDSMEPGGGLRSRGVDHGASADAAQRKPLASSAANGGSDARSSRPQIPVETAGACGSWELNFDPWDLTAEQWKSSTNSRIADDRLAC